MPYLRDPIPFPIHLLQQRELLEVTVRQQLHDQVSFTAFASLLEDLQQQSALLLATLPLHELLAEQLELLGTEQQFQRLYYGQGYSLQPLTAENVQLTRSLLNLVQDQGKRLALPSMAIQHGVDSVVEYLRRALIQRIVTEEREQHTPQFTQDLARELLQTWSDSGRDSGDKLEGFLRRHYFALDHQDTLYAADMLPEMLELNKTYKESDNPQQLRPLYQQLLHLLHSVAGEHRPASGQIPLSMVRKWYDSLGTGLTGYYFAREVAGKKTANTSSAEPELSSAATAELDADTLSATQSTTVNQDAALEIARTSTATKRSGRKTTATRKTSRSAAAGKAQVASVDLTNKATGKPTDYQGVNFTKLDWEQLVAAPLAARNYLPREWRNLLTADAILSYIPAELPPLTHMVYRGMISYYLRPQLRSEMRAPSVPTVQPAPPVPTRRTRKEVLPQFRAVRTAQLHRLSDQLHKLLSKS